MIWKRSLGGVGGVSGMVWHVVATINLYPILTGCWPCVFTHTAEKQWLDHGFNIQLQISHKRHNIKSIA